MLAECRIERTTASGAFFDDKPRKVVARNSVIYIRKSVAKNITENKRCEREVVNG